MVEFNKRIALLGVTNEEIESRSGNRQVVLFKSNMPDIALPDICKIPTHELCEARHGSPFKSPTVRLSMAYPYREDLLSKERVNGHLLEIYRLTSCNDILFSYKEKEAYDQLKKQIIARAQCRLIMPERGKVLRFVRSMFRDKHYIKIETKWDRKGEETKIPITLETPCRLIFSKKRDCETKKTIERHIDHEIGKPIEERFGLEQLGVSYGFSSHKFRLNEEAKDAFYRKYPEAFRRSDAFTLWHLMNMTYDLVHIRHKNLPLK
ncbi:hypothetical protein A2Z10_00475 [Candidatus Azambacteria bacterium RBG_16_47_10]|uniref:Uncharacterized protein n=1 Tax=Candidatus Azambacteria bacterium RBG_16_47_10 TaxID=1797292 RepID=A0A1F5AYH2_9BACT|nr:MAG: hypothetical protein A2Z10_00475 [Candidatus Azambacteria bacterium RBG_16_47_10]